GTVARCETTSPRHQSPPSASPDPSEILHMRAVLQRVSRASVSVEASIVGSIGPGWLVMLGVGRSDTEADAAGLAAKVVLLRGFEYDQGKMNHSVIDTNGQILVVSQFTLMADCRSGRRPSFIDAADPGQAEHLYERFVEQVRRRGVTASTGQFRAMM